MGNKLAPVAVVAGSSAAFYFSRKPISLADNAKPKEDCGVCQDNSENFFAQIRQLNAGEKKDPQAGWEGEGVKCPLDRRSVGWHTWGFLHTMAAHYPDNPTRKQQQDMITLMNLIADFYPCGYCADKMKDELIVHPPLTQNRQAFMKWMCDLHNEVNDRMGKEIFDCSKYEQRWRTGPADGSCGKARKL
eukprot:TRINITY_DN3588_c0_g1_i1.p1 TRINITY_DN3588_c0_g1~~TRINITY_DN3588_c0_g1_i1.p1  ORF type:complete len:189 (+),score=39.46 TRINITY_DN3588_c0_g1_i1:77-643(+)